MNEATFWSHVDKSGICWIWNGTRDKDGYGRFDIFTPKRIQKAHRISYLIHNGHIEDNLMVCHSCDNPSCVNPDHLFQGTAKDNTQDMIKKGRQSKGNKVPYTNRPRGEKHSDARFTKKQVIEIRKRYKDGGIIDNLAEEYKVNRSSIARLIHGETWAHIKEHVSAIKEMKGEKNGMAIFTEQQVIEIRSRHATGNITMYKLSKEYNVNFNTISNIIKRKSWYNI